MSDMELGGGQVEGIPREPSDELIGQLTAVWNRAMGPEYPLRPKLLRQALDEFVDGRASSIYWAGERPVGFLVAKTGEGVPWAGRGARWLTALVVDPALQRTGIGSRLLAHAMTSLRAAGAVSIALGQDPNHLLSGLPEDSSPAFWRDHAVQEHDVFSDVVADLRSWQPPPDLPPLRPATDWSEPTDFCDRCFPGRWAWTMREHARLGSEPARCLLLDRDGTVVGFVLTAEPGSENPIEPSLYWEEALPGAVGGVGPLGIDPDLHGRRLGTGMVAAALEQFRRRDVRFVVADWTTRVRFYEHLGFRVWRRTRGAALPIP